MSTIYTAVASNNGFYIALAVAAADEATARTAFKGELSAPEDEGGDYTLGTIDARLPDHDGDYAPIGSTSTDLSADQADELLASPGVVVMLESGANG